MLLSQQRVYRLGGLGAVVVGDLDTTVIMRIYEVSIELGSWVEAHVSERISERAKS